MPGRNILARCTGLLVFVRDGRIILGEPGGTNLSRSEQTGARGKTKRLEEGLERKGVIKFASNESVGEHQSSPRNICG